MITLTIDGREAVVAPGTLLVEAARRIGVQVPVFCYHPRMAPVGACRMCLVHVEKMPKLVPACATPAQEGMVVRTDTEEVMRSHEGILDFLLGTHPLDCPVCDAGGRCDLQNNAMRFAANRSHYAEPKRHLKKAWHLGPMVELDQERCILCTRCVRFMAEVAGDPALTLHERGGHTVVDVAEGRSFDSIFAGNTIEICPVGALTSRPFRFHARPWDMDSVDSVCPHCPVGCRTRIALRRGDIMEVVARDNEEVNWSWLCDRGRFGYGFVHDASRPREPLLRQGGSLRAVGWPEVLDAVRAGLSGRVGLIGGARCSLEAQYLLRRYVREELGSPNLDHRVLGLLTAIPPGPVGRIADVDDADLVVALDAELLEEAPVLALRIRHFARLGQLRVLAAGVSSALLDLPHEHLDPDPARALQDLADGRGASGRAFLHARKVVLLWSGRGREVGETLPAAVAARAGETFTLVVGGLGNSFGAQAAGLVPAEGGLDVRGMLEAARDGRLDALLIVAQDYLDFPDTALLDAAIDRVPFLAVAATTAGPLAERAAAVLPLAAWAESDGHFVNLEGRAQRYFAGAARASGQRDDWRPFAELLGLDWGQERIAEELRRELPELFGADRCRGAALPSGGAPTTLEAALAPSLFQKGFLPEPLLRPLVPQAEVLASPLRLEELGRSDGEELRIGAGRYRLRATPGLPAEEVRVRAGTPGSAEVLRELVRRPVGSGRAPGGA